MKAGKGAKVVIKGDLSSPESVAIALAGIARTMKSRSLIFARGLRLSKKPTRKAKPKRRPAKGGIN